MTLTDYLALFPGATREKARFMALAEAVLRQVTDLMALTEQIQSGFSFAAAEGKQLDDLAAAVGLARPAPDCPDRDFRAYLLAKLALWTWDGTNETVQDVLDLALPGTRMTDNGNGTVTVTGNRELVPVPAGVRVIHNSQFIIHNSEL